jgi:hypothetical protein
MKHISVFLSARSNQLSEQKRQLSLFAAPREKGSSEWGVFDAVRGDRVSMFRMRLPQKPIVTREPGHILRIMYPARDLQVAH